MQYSEEKYGVGSSKREMAEQKENHILEEKTADRGKWVGGRGKEIKQD